MITWNDFRKWFTKIASACYNIRGKKNNKAVIPMYSIVDIANWFLQKEPMTHKKIQKICYYAVAWNYALKNKDLCIDGEFQAWVHGPVSPVLYEIYKGSGWEEHDLRSSPPTMDKETEELLESVWETYGEKTGNALEALSHSEFPWMKARVGVPAEAPSNNPIEKKDMHDFYLSIYDGTDE